MVMAGVVVREGERVSENVHDKGEDERGEVVGLRAPVWRLVVVMVVVVVVACGGDGGGGNGSLPRWSW